MSVGLYDKALAQKIQAWFQNTDLHIYSPQDAKRILQVYADTNNDKPLELPLIVITRNPEYTILDPAMSVLSYNGHIIEQTEANTMMQNGIPIQIQYRLDVYTRKFEDADEITRHLIFSLLNHPALEVTIPYNGTNRVHQSSISLGSQVTDNSDIPERLIAGQFTRMSLNLTIPDAYIWDMRIYPNVSIEGIVEIG